MCSNNSVWATELHDLGSHATRRFLSVSRDIEINDSRVTSPRRIASLAPLSRRSPSPVRSPQQPIDGSASARKFHSEHELLHDGSFTFVGEGSICVPKRLRGAGEIGWNIDEDATCKQQPRGSNDAGS